MNRKRLRPQHAVIAIGVAFALVTVVSGIAATVNQWHDDSEQTRETFANIPSALKLAF